MHLDVFILSYNRADFLRETLESFLQQSFQGFRLIILDNASTDDTAAVVDSFAERRPIIFHRQQENVGALKNFLQIQTLAEADWVMAFHDDDILHPRYLEHCMEVLVQNPECRLVASNYSGMTHPDLPVLAAQSFDKNFWRLKNAAHLASFCYTINKVHFGSVIYRRECLREISASQIVCFGKMLDRPLMISTLLGGGAAVIFKAPFIQYRLHSAQDSQSPLSGPFLNEAIALTRFYAEVMGKNWRTSAGRCFLVNNRGYLKGLYKWCTDRDSQRFSNFVFKAYTQGVATLLSFVPRPLMRIVKKAFRLIDSDFF
jgi:glycosyltransferase involved in cell wall biosynthesis